MKECDRAFICMHGESSKDVTPCSWCINYSKFEPKSYQVQSQAFGVCPECGCTNGVHFSNCSRSVTSLFPGV